MDIEIRMKAMEDKLEETLQVVKEIRTIVIGSEHNRQDSMLVKISEMRKEIDNLKNDKITRDANSKIAVIISGFIGTIAGSIVVAIVIDYLQKHP